MEEKLNIVQIDMAQTKRHHPEYIIYSNRVLMVIPAEALINFISETKTVLGLLMDLMEKDMV